MHTARPPYPLLALLNRAELTRQLGQKQRVNHVVRGSYRVHNTELNRSQRTPEARRVAIVTRRRTRPSGIANESTPPAKVPLNGAITKSLPPSIVPSLKGEQIVDLYDAASYHQLALGAAGRSPATLRLYLLYQKRFLEFLASRQIAPTLEALSPLYTRQAVLWFQQRRLGQRGGASATAMFLNVLKTWSSFLEAEGIYVDSPLRRVQRVSVRKLERAPYTRAECNAILHACASSASPERDRALVEILLGSGARIGEVTGLRLSDVRFDQRTMRVVGKGNRERTVPLGDPEQPDGGSVWRAWRLYLKVRQARVERSPDRTRDHLFLTQAGYPLTAEGGADVIRRLGSAAGVEGAIPHRFRHTFCTVYLTRYPGDELGLRRIIGHISKVVLADYVHLATAEIARRAGRGSPTTAWLKERST